MSQINQVGLISECDKRNGFQCQMHEIPMNREVSVVSNWI